MEIINKKQASIYIFLMIKYKEFLSKLGLISCSQCTKYIKSGNTICINNDEAEGIYWYYETEDFIIDIHDLYIKKETNVKEIGVYGDKIFGKLAGYAQQYLFYYARERGIGK